MKDFYTRPHPSKVFLKEGFWKTYTENFKNITIPYAFQKFEETKTVENFINTAKNNGSKHVGLPFSDGLLLETITGASNFLASEYDQKLDKKLDELIEIIVAAQQEDGFLCTATCQENPDKRWGENGGDIVIQHDIYNHGTLIEAAVAHYIATKKLTLLLPALKSVKLICSHIGEAPKHHVIPGHSLSELAFMELYRLISNDSKTEALAKENGVLADDILEIVRFWYDRRGDQSRRTFKEMSEFEPERWQNTMPLGEMRSAMGHAVRAGLCYAGAASYYRQSERSDYFDALRAIWQDITTKKMHISGGVGSRADIEGFDAVYSLQNDAYLETCAGIALAFFAGEMALADKNSEYFDIFELSLYNNILGSMGKDFKMFYYDNPLISDGTKNRWAWHDCPCCPPMLSKIYSSLPGFIYSYKKDEICTNMYINSKFENDDFAIEQNDKHFKITVHKNQIKAAFRIPSYAQNFDLSINGKKANLEIQNGYADIYLNNGINEITVNYQEKLCEIYANCQVEADRGQVCIMKGPYLYCAEGADNNGKVDFTLAENTNLTVSNDTINATAQDGTEILLIPYYKRNNRVNENTNDSKMAVWFKKQNMTYKDTNDNLYGYYKIH